MSKIILPPKTIGILGAGQLGRMIAISAASLGYKIISYCPKRSDEIAPAEQVSNKIYYNDYDDFKSLEKFSNECDIVTFEFENIPVESVEFLERKGKVRPNSNSIFIAQNRLRERVFFTENNLPTHKFFHLRSPEDLKKAFEENNLSKAILKSSAFGYDGKGQAKISKNDNFEEVWNDLAFEDVVMEEFVNFEQEISVILARSVTGEIKIFPIGQNIHESGILKKSILPSNVSDATKDKAINCAKEIAEKLDYIGVIAVEFFVLEDGNISINEIAPRVHNSGHWTNDFCITSQFEQHVRAICGLPLTSTEMICNKVEMINLIGEDVNNIEKFYQEENTKVHLYGKELIKSGRKLGHVNRKVS